LQAQTEATVEIRGIPAFRLEMIDTVDPVPVGGRTVYKINVTNQGSLPGNQVQIVAMVPAEMRPINANGPVQARIEGQRVTFGPVDGLLPKQTFGYSVEVEALRAGDLRFHAELRAATLTEPVIEEESTHVYMPVPGAGQPVPSNAPAAPPSAPASPPTSPVPTQPPAAPSTPGSTPGPSSQPTQVPPSGPPPASVPAPLPRGPVQPPPG
jgi:hypothetical protein